MTVSILSRLTEKRLESLVRGLAAGDALIDFATPPGEAAVVSPESVSWQVFRNPLTMVIGGIAAVLLELGEPRVRSGVWTHSSFRADPARRLRRTGLAAMVTVYGARSRFEALATRVRGMHARVAGTTRGGEGYRADDPDLLRWVHGTAAFAFLEAYRIYVRPVAPADRERYYAEGGAGSRLYGVVEAPASEAATAALFDAMRPRLEPSPELDELIAILRAAPILPPLLRPLQHSLIRAAVDLLPAAERERLQLGRHGGLRFGEAALLRSAARMLDGIAVPSSPSAQACVRVGLPHDWLVRHPLPG
ncbi:oxygenase MpaB family protein [Glacieibacterium megasporae]|uniref:oxygenase MpaB family protein n=1 Tax=Glacieibacterium megasporae TaxID=2835787 RepID=UPI001C1DD6C3|nr:oxygenase MpaB family protein [Polymorphobacter megasporae]UAJ10041.1 oxygenase MpaB family protein [Polymorphobacter megasporae]